MPSKDGECRLNSHETQVHVDLQVWPWRWWPRMHRRRIILANQCSRSIKLIPLSPALETPHLTVAVYGGRKSQRLYSCV